MDDVGGVVLPGELVVVACDVDVESGVVAVVLPAAVEDVPVDRELGDVSPPPPAGEQPTINTTTVMRTVNLISIVCFLDPGNGSRIVVSAPLSKSVSSRF